MAPAPGQSARPLLIAVFVVHALLIGLGLANDWVSHQDENYYLSVTRTMLDTGDYLVPEYDGPRIKKPILFYWLIVPWQWLLGYGFWSTRVVSLLASSALLAMAWKISGFHMTDARRRLAVVWMLASADIVFRYAHYAVPETTLTAAMTAAHWAFLCHVRARDEGRTGRRALLTFWAMMGVAFMIKGPVGILLPLVTGVVYHIAQRRPREAVRLISPSGLLVLVAIISPWYLMLIGTLGLDTVLGMVRHEIGSRVGAERTLGGLFFFLAVGLLYYLPWTVLLIERPAEKWRTFTRAAVATTGRSYPFVWLVIYFLFYTFVVAENHQWYALQWAVPWIILLAGLIDLDEAKLRPLSVFWWSAIGAGCFAVCLVVAWWALGPVLGSPAAIAILVGVSVAASVLMTALLRMTVEPLHRVIAVAVLAMVGHTLAFHLVVTTTQLRPATAFAHELQRVSGPYELLIGDRYLEKKLMRYALPGAEATIYEEDEAAFRQAWAGTLPAFVICREDRLDDMPESRRYDLVAEGFVRRADRSAPGERWKLFLRERDPHLIFDRAVLLRRDDGP